MISFHMPEVRQLIFLGGMAIGALTSFLSGPIAKRVGKGESFQMVLKLIGLGVTLIFAILLFTLT